MNLPSDDTPIDKLPITSRTKNAFRNDGRFKSVGDLRHCKRMYAIYCTPGIGKKSIDELWLVISGKTWSNARRGFTQLNKNDELDFQLKLVAMTKQFAEEIAKWPHQARITIDHNQDSIAECHISIAGKNIYTGLEQNKTET